MEALIYIYIYFFYNNLGSITPNDQSSRVFYIGGHCWGMVIPDHGLPLTWNPRWSRRSVEMTGEILPPPELEMTSHSCWILKIPTLIYIYIHLYTFMTFNWIVVESFAKPKPNFIIHPQVSILMGARFTIPSPPSCEASKDAVVSSHSVLDTLMHLKSAGAQGATGNVRESEPNWEFPSLRKVFGVARL